MSLENVFLCNTSDPFFLSVNRILIPSKLFYIYRSLILSEFSKLKF